MARPKIEEKYRAIQICFQLMPDTAEKLDRCRQPWQARSAQIREIIEAYLTKIQAN